MIKSPAKINLFLHVLGKDYRGYHLLESLAVFVPELFDKIKIRKGRANEVVFTGPWRDRIGQQNTVTKALELLAKHIPDKFQISIEKNIPVGAGLGGGSSNAGSIIRYLLNKYKIQIPKKIVLELCNQIGSDVAMFMYAKALYIRGTGDIFTHLKSFPSVSILIIYPKIELSTQHVYNLGFKRFSKQMPSKLSFSSQCPLIADLQLKKNDLYPNALKIFPQLKPLITVIKETKGCLLARMTGSGSACFGLFDGVKNANLSLKTLQKRFPDYSIYIGNIK